MSDTFPAEGPDNGPESNGDGPTEAQVASALAEHDPAAELDVKAERERLLDEILAAGEPRPGLNVSDFARLRKLKDQKALYAAMGRALEKPIRELTDKLSVHVVEVDEEADLRRGWSTTVGDTTCYSKVSDYPAYRHRDTTTDDGAPGDGQVDEDGGAGPKFEMADLIVALDECAETLPDWAALVRRSVHGQQWNSHVQQSVRAWHERVGESDGVRNADGALVDAFGNVLTEDEAEDPTADELALPPSIRRIVKISPKVDFQFRKK